MKLHLFLICLTLSFSGIGQSHYIGFKLSSHWTSVQFNSVHPFYDNSPDPMQTFSPSLTYEYELNQTLSLGSEIVWDRRGYKEVVILRDDNGNTIDDDYSTFTNFDYLAMPLKISIGTGNKTRAYISIGIVPALLIDASNTGPYRYGSNGNIIDTTVHETEFYTKFDLGTIGEMGVVINVAKKISLVPSLHFQYSLTRYEGDFQFNTNSKYRHWGIGLNVGVRYNLSNPTGEKLNESL